ncbi:MAG: hypothetical protein RLY14_2761 [Planctomycetota bacterium]|jgi:uncharacterized tellurite resistance protein B-like protein
MQRLDQLKNLVIMAAADGTLAQAEIAMLIQRCSELGLNETDLENAIDYALSDKPSLKLPDTKEEKLQLLSDLLLVMAADGKLREVEKRLFAVAAAKMNVGQADLDALIDRLVGKNSSTRQTG